MKPPPTEFDGASLVCFAEISGAIRPTGKTKHVRDGEAVATASGLAICQYEGDSSFYFFYCDEDWEVLADTFHSTIEDAKEQAEFEYEGISSNWKPAA
jgi:hypothetical protein